MSSGVPDKVTDVFLKCFEIVIVRLKDFLTIFNDLDD